MGKETLGSMVKTMCAKAGITGNKTNHSLKATGATRMFEGNVPEKLFKSELDIGVLRLYAHTNILHYSSKKLYRVSLQLPVKAILLT